MQLNEHTRRMTQPLHPPRISTSTSTKTAKRSVRTWRSDDHFCAASLSGSSSTPKWNGAVVLSPYSNFLCGAHGEPKFADPCRKQTRKQENENSREFTSECLVVPPPRPDGGVEQPDFARVREVDGRHQRGRERHEAVIRIPDCVHLSQLSHRLQTIKSGMELEGGGRREEEELTRQDHQRTA